MNAATPVISCKNVWKLFGANPEQYLKSLTGNPGFDEIRQAGYIAAVRDVSLDIAKGEMLVIMGLSGSGKSTFVRCLSRLIDITGGEVRVEGQNIGEMSEKELIDLRRNKMGMVFQSFGLLPHRTVLDNVAFPLEMRGQDRHERRARALEVIELVGLSGREDYFPRELSGGQQQRVGIARSLAIEPDIWFLDEPFSALDPLIRREMQDEFLRLQERLHKTIVFITHDFEEAVRLADRIAIMKDGEVIQIATPEELVMNPATDYVAEFTRHIPRSKVLTVGGVMTAGAAGDGDPILQSTRVSDVAERIIAADAPIPVSDSSGQVVGAIDRKAVAHVLFGEGDAA